MSEWWTYQPADFLMFSPRIYWRLFESINIALWPAQALVLVAGLFWIARQAQPTRTLPATWWRATAAVLALGWGFVAWAFLLQRFAPIQPAAGAFAIAFTVQALALATLAAVGGVRGVGSGPRRRAGLALAAWALFGYPLLPALFDRPWQQAEVFALAPDPTAIATLAVLLLTAACTHAARWLLRALWVVPLAWCVISATTLWTMGSSQPWWVLAAMAVAVVAALWRPTHPG